MTEAPHSHVGRLGRSGGGMGVDPPRSARNGDFLNDVRSTDGRTAPGDRQRDQGPGEGCRRSDNEAGGEGTLAGIWTGPSVMVRLVRIAAMTAPATVVPMDRISALTPTAEPASLSGTLSMTRVGIAAYPMPTPAEAMHEASMSSHGASMRNSAVR